MTAPRVLVAGVGNIFFGDDAFGVEVARRLAAEDLPADVRVAEFGIRGLDLAFAMLDGPQALVLVDAVSRGGPPGTLYVIEPERPAAADEPASAGHDLVPAEVLRLVHALGARPSRVLVVGCEPATLEPDEDGGLSAPVRAAVDAALPLVRELVDALLREAVHA